MVMIDNENVGTRKVELVGLSSMAMLDNAKIETREIELIG